MNITYETTLTLFADYFQFSIEDENAEDSDFGDKWTISAIESLLAIGDKGKSIGIGTVRNMTVPIALKVFSSEPPVQIDKLENVGQINECDLEITSGKVVVIGIDYYPDAKRIELENGIYRLRIYYGNLNTLSEDGLDGDDFYEIHLWKTDKKEDVKILLQRDTTNI
jgi:hypothetical protein